jgi:L-ascorbate metabolism protein UlaG (beta-lactamase superfamily)
MGLCENTGYMVAEKFYFPGDNFHNPGKPVDVLALPVAGPWMKMSEAIDFAKQIKARTAFGVHDGMIQPFFRGFVGNALKMFVPDTEYVAMQDGETHEF